MSTAANAIRGAYEAFARGDAEAVLEVLADDVSWEVTEVLPQGGSFQGKQAVAGFLRALGEVWESIELDIEDLIDGGDEVVVIGRGEGDLRDVGHAGYGFAHVFTFRGEKVARFREYADPDPAVVRAH